MYLFLWYLKTQVERSPPGRPPTSPWAQWRIEATALTTRSTSPLAAQGVGSDWFRIFGLLRSWLLLSYVVAKKAKTSTRRRLRSYVKVGRRASASVAFFASAWHPMRDTLSALIPPWLWPRERQKVRWFFANFFRRWLVRPVLLHKGLCRTVVSTSTSLRFLLATAAIAAPTRRCRRLRRRSCPSSSCLHWLRRRCAACSPGTLSTY